MGIVREFQQGSYGLSLLWYSVYYPTPGKGTEAAQEPERLAEPAWWSCVLGFRTGGDTARWPHTPGPYFTLPPEQSRNASAPFCKPKKENVVLAIGLIVNACCPQKPGPTPHGLEVVA
jgi:hypothetical protein